MTQSETSAASHAEFVKRWENSAAAERANYQLFLSEFCDFLEVPRPQPTVADLSTVWLSADVPEPFIRFVHVGDAVTIGLVAFPDEVLTGRVARIGDVLDPQTRSLKVNVELANPQGRFRPDMYGTIRHSGPMSLSAVVPAAAVIQEYGRSVVFLERGPGQFERRTVTTGVRAGDRLAVRSGLESGDRVVVDGAVLLKGQ